MYLRGAFLLKIESTNALQGPRRERRRVGESDRGACQVVYTNTTGCKCRGTCKGGEDLYAALDSACGIEGRTCKEEVEKGDGGANRRRTR